MTVDQLIAALQALSDAGLGDIEARVYSDMSGHMDGYEPVATVEPVEIESGGRYVRIE